jgi:hypothetical protein
MARELKPIDISNVPDLLRLVEEVRSTNEPRLLRRDSEDLAVLAPVRSASKRPRGGAKTEADYEVFRSSAGGWKGLVDTEAFKRNNRASRRTSSRPPITL